MGVDSNIYLPSDIGDRHLADAMGIFAGLPKKLVQYNNHMACEVEGAQTKPTFTPSMGQIILRAPLGQVLVDGEDSHEVNFHWGSRFKKQIWILISPRSTPFWIAVGRRLVDWFGGYLVFSDCAEDSGSNLYKGKRSHPVDENGFLPHGDDAWIEYHTAASKLTQVTEQELRAAWKMASYREQFDPSGRRPENVKA